MRFVAVVLVALLTGTGAARDGSQVQAASVKDAETALVTSLTRHDRAAFERVLDDDATFFLPTFSQGRDAILKSWVLFLLPSNATMTLTPGEAVVSTSQDLAYTRGTYAFATDNNGKVTTVMSGSYLAVWRQAGGKWTLKAFAGATERQAVPAAAPNANAGVGPATPPAGSSPMPIDRAALANGGGLGAYRFGMSLDEVRKVDACKPYMDVRTTGGLECPNYVFEGRKINISFIFASNALRRIQLWLYEGESDKDARKAADFGIDFLKRTAGGAHMYGLGQNAEVNGETILKVLKTQETPAGRGVVADLQTPSSDSPERWYSRVSRNVLGTGDWFGVFLFVEARLPAGPR